MDLRIEQHEPESCLQILQRLKSDSTDLEFGLLFAGAILPILTEFEFNNTLSAIQPDMMKGVSRACARRR